MSRKQVQTSFNSTPKPSSVKSQSFSLNFKNFILTKKNLDGNFLFKSYKMQEQMKIQVQKRKIIFQNSLKIKPNNGKYIFIKRKSISSQTSRENKKLQSPILSTNIKNYKKIKITQLNEQQKQKQCQNLLYNDKSQMINSINEKQQKRKSQLTQCNVRKCNLLTQFISSSTYSTRKEYQNSLRKSTLSKIRKINPCKKTQTKTLKQFFPFVQIYNFSQILKNNHGQLFNHFIQSFNSKSISLMLDNVIIFQKLGDYKRQIASLTKIITCITALWLSEKFKVNIQNSSVKISKQATILGGTTANLRQGDILNLNDLLHGMMLPSGNDAAFAIAQFFGRLLFKQSPEYENKMKQFMHKQTILFAYNLKNQNQSIGLRSKLSQKLKTSSGCNNKQQFIPASYISSNQAVNYFIVQMNKITQYLKLSKTNFSNCHGLSDPRNKSTSNNVISLCYIIMKNNQKFRTIVRQQKYETKIYNKNSKMIRVQKWQNSNFLLQKYQKKCIGIKTGNTPNAGSCLATTFKIISNKNIPHDISIVLLNSPSKSDRFRQTQQIYYKIYSSLQYLIETVQKIQQSKVSPFTSTDSLNYQIQQIQ